MNDRGHRFRAELKASATTRQLDSRYDIPIGDPALERLSLEGQNNYENPADINTNTTTLTPSITRVVGRWQTVTSLSATRTSDRQRRGQASPATCWCRASSLASVPKDFLGEALFSRTLLRGADRLAFGAGFGLELPAAAWCRANTASI